MLIIKKFGMFIRSIIYGVGVNPLPNNIVLSLFFILLFHSMTMTMPFSFIPKMVKSFGNSETQTGYKVGILGGALFLGRIISSILWGWAADRYGRKKFALISALSLATFTLAFGFTFNFIWAVITRLLQGLSMGLIVIAKAMIGECSDNTNQNIGMTIIIGAYCLGMIIGPSVGGFLAFPHDQYPDSFSKDNIFSKFGALLPSFIVASGLYIGIVIVWIFVPNSSKKTLNVEEKKILQTHDKKLNEKTRLIDVENDVGKYQIKMIIMEANSPQQLKISASRKSAIRVLLKNKGCVLSCLLNGIISFIQVAYDEVFPLYAATTKTFKGYEFKPFEIGSTLMIVAGIAICLQFTMMSRILDRFGLIKTMKCLNLLQTIMYPIIPACHYITNRYLFWFTMITTAGFIRIAGIINFVCVNVLINNSVEQKFLGSVNGISMSVATLCRAVSVPLFGLLYSWSLKNIKSIDTNIHPIGFPFNQFFIFLLFSIGHILIAAYMCLLPISLEKKYIAINNEDDGT